MLALAALLAGGLAASAAEPSSVMPPGWLNARDVGASGSEYSTTAATTRGLKEITVAAVGDFQVGQGIMLAECHPRTVGQTLWGPRHVVVMGRPLQDKAEIRGYDGTQGDWLILLLDVPEGTRTFRWSEDQARSWKPTVPITGDWQPLRDGIEVRFNPHDWEKGYTVCFSSRGQLVTTIEKIEGQKVTLRDAPTRTVSAAAMRHCDDAALQAAIDQAVKEKRNLYVPVGRYRLSRGLTVRNPTSFTIEGANAVDTILDISEGQGACLTLSLGNEATVRNFTMVGHSGFAERDQCGLLRTLGSSYFWGFGAKGCNAITIGNTQRVLVENCHGRRMATECFVSGSRSRGLPDKPNANHSQSTVYRRCSAIDCGRNAFNDVTSGSENTSVIECRIVDVGGCAWEGASRFVKFTGNYVRNAGTVAMGNLGPANHDATFPELGAGQHIIANNVFESVVPYGGCAVRAAVGATQVLVTGNLFVNFGSSAVHLSGNSDATHYPTSTATISGNLFDMTEVGPTSAPRTAIDVSAAGVIVADNQIYVRGPCDPKVTALRLLEPAVDLTVHDNLIRNCGIGIAGGRAASRVGAVTDPRTFTLAARVIPLDHRLPSQGAGWQVAWLTGGRATGLSTIEAITGAAATDTVAVTLTEPHASLKAGDSFEVIPPAANWNLHSNTVTDCLQPVVLDGYGSVASRFRDNLVTRGATVGVKQGLQLRGRFQVVGNQFTGFDEPGSVALVLDAGPFRETSRSLVQRNVFTRCVQAVAATPAELWGAVGGADNAFIESGAAPLASGSMGLASPAPAVAPPAAAPVVPAAIRRPLFVAARAGAMPTLDGRVDEWPWEDGARVITIAQPPAGAPLTPPPGRACAAWDERSLYLAVRLAIPKGAPLRGGTDVAACDGVEVSLQAPSDPTGAPIVVLWGSSEGSFLALPAGGASPEQCKTLQGAVTYAAHVAPDEWTCEWRLPFAALGVDPAPDRALRFNLGAHLTASAAWIAWQATGGAFYEVGQAGDLRLAR